MEHQNIEPIFPAPIAQSTPKVSIESAAESEIQEDYGETDFHTIWDSGWAVHTQIFSRFCTETAKEKVGRIIQACHRSGAPKQLTGRKKLAESFKPTEVKTIKQDWMKSPNLTVRPKRKTNMPRRFAEEKF